MNTNSLRRYFLTTLSSLFTAAVLTACGGGGDSSSGSGGSIAGSASISGNVSSGLALNQSAAPGERLLDALFELVISDAHAAGVGGVTVELLKGGVVVDSQITDASGEFQFTGVAPGNYTIRLTQGGRNVGVSPMIQMDANTRTRLELGLYGGLMAVEVKAENGKISGEVEDGISNDDQNSADDVSSDDQGSTDDTNSNDDQKSEDNKSEDECKPSASEDCDDD
jgi:hypothetical protein